MKKIYVLDTNILMQSPRALFGFADNDIYLPTTVIRELDKHKTDSGERGYNTREVIRMLEDLRRSYVATHAAGEEIKGIEMPNGGTLHIAESEIDHPDFLPRDLGLSYDIPDMRIIGAVYKLTKENTEPVILVTNDAAMRFNAFVSTKNSITIQNYRNETIETDERYTGKAELTVNPSVIGKLYKEKQIDFKEVLESFMESALYENEYMHFVANDGSQQSAVGIFRDGKINLINADITTYGGIKGKNLSQKCLLHALMQPAEQIPLVIAKGPAGTGKTLLSVACGLDVTYDDHTGRRYNEMLLTRSNVQADNDLGALPGDLQDKMSPLVRPFYDNMERIFAGEDNDIATARQQIDFVRACGTVNICPVGYVRGRTLDHRYLIVDEAQNLTVTQALTLITRAGYGTKIVFCGDPDQIDAKYLDKRNNGLVFAAEKMKGSKYCAQITFDQEEAVRSDLAMEAVKRMTI